MNTAIIYHQIKPDIDCPDGIAGAWVCKQKYPDADLIGASYGNPPAAEISEYDRIVIVDFSFERSLLQKWATGSELLVIDHHKTAMQQLEGFASAVFDMNESGATLAWKTLFPSRQMPAFLAYVRDRDLWNFELAHSEEIHEVMSYMGRKFHQLDFLAQLSQDELVRLLAPLGAKLLEPKRKRITELASTAHKNMIHGWDVMAIEIPEDEARLVSDICSAVYKQNPDRWVAAYCWNSKNQEWDLSFRSDKNGMNFDVSEIAKRFGGGGHRNAAGAKTKKLEDVFTFFPAKFN